MTHANKFRLYLMSLLLVQTALAYALETKKSDVSPYDGYSFTTGLEYENGDYGTADSTDLWRIPLGLQYRSGQYTFGASTALLSAKSTGTIIVSSDRMTMKVNTPPQAKVTMGTPGSGSSSATGIDDIDLYATYRLPRDKDSDIRYHVSVVYKLATADADKGLGTGENDIAFEGGLLTSYKDVLLMGILGYQINGDSATVDYKDVWYTDLSVIYPVKPDRSLGATLYLAQTATPGFDAPADLTLFLNQELDKRRDLYFYVLFGLSDGSPDLGIGADITFKL